MGQWLSSREFAKLYGYKYEALKKACIRAYKAGKNFCNIKCIKIHFTYTKGIGRGGKVLQIWSEPFSSEAEAEAFIMAYRVDMLERAVKQSKLDCLSSLDSVFPRHEEIKHGRIESSNIQDIQQNTVSSDNTQSKEIESNIASINTKLDTTMGGVVDFNNVSVRDNSVLPQYDKGNVQHGINKITTYSKNASDTVAGHENIANNTIEQVRQKKEVCSLADNKTESTRYKDLTPFDFATTKARRIALEKKRIVKEWESLKKKGVLEKRRIGKGLYSLCECK